MYSLFFQNMMSKFVIQNIVVTKIHFYTEISQIEQHYIVGQICKYVLPPASWDLIQSIFCMVPGLEGKTTIDLCGGSH